MTNPSRPLRSRVRHLLAAPVLAAAFLTAAAAPVPSPEKLLPSDTVALLTVPDVNKARAEYAQSAAAGFWGDPSMKPFRAKFEARFQEDVLDPIEKELGVKLASYADLAQGQVTLAVFQTEPKGDDIPFAWALVVDSGAKSDQLKKAVAELRKKWTDAGKKLRTEKIREIEFTVVPVDDKAAAWLKSKGGDDADEGEDKKDAKDASKDAAAGKSFDLLVGQSDSLLVVGSNAKAIEKILSRQSGGAVPALGEQAAFDKDYQARFRSALGYGWLNAKPLVDLALKLAGAAGEEAAAMGIPSPSKIMGAVGITGLRTISFSSVESKEGSSAEFHLGTPAAERAGLFKLFEPEAKDSSPPAFVPADAVQFFRWRHDIQKVWAGIEALVNQLSPQFGGMLKMMVENLGKDKDPNFDIRRSFIANLGDDVLSYVKAPRSAKLADIGTPPTIYFVGSAAPDKLAAAFRTVIEAASGGAVEVKEREFLGRKVFAIDAGSDGDVPRKVSFAGSSGYLVISLDEALLESHLRSSESPAKPLRELPALTEAAQRVGGTGTGLFGYENTAESMKNLWASLKGGDDTIGGMLNAVTLRAAEGDKPARTLKDWLDFSLLPAFDQVAKYFSITVYAGGSTADGFGYKAFTPTPAGLKK